MMPSFLDRFHDSYNKQDMDWCFKSAKLVAYYTQRNPHKKNKCMSLLRFFETMKKRLKQLNNTKMATNHFVYYIKSITVAQWLSQSFIFEIRTNTDEMQ